MALSVERRPSKRFLRRRWAPILILLSASFLRLSIRREREISRSRASRLDLRFDSPTLVHTLAHLCEAHHTSLKNPHPQLAGLEPDSYPKGLLQDVSEGSSPGCIRRVFSRMYPKGLLQDVSEGSSPGWRKDRSGGHKIFLNSPK